MNETTQQPRAGQTVRAARVVPATPAVAYQACTDAASMATWWGHTENATLFLCEADVRVGGHYRYGIRSASGKEEMVSGSFLEVYPGSRLVFSWTDTVAGKDGGKDAGKDATEVVHESRVTIDLLDLKDGTTRVVITHQGLPTAEANRYNAGWHDLIQDLTLHLANQ